ncbi:MAG: hypothetical protein RIE32_00545 [Phycisphaerales bacterium]
MLDPRRWAGRRACWNVQEGGRTMARRAKKGEADFLNQCMVLAGKWDKIDPALIGLSSQFVGSFEEKRQAATDAARAAERAQNALANAMLRKQIAMGALRASFGAATGQIDAHAKATGDAGVYPKAGIPRPEKPGKRPAPPTPVLRRPRMLGYGPVELSFTPSGEGAQYEVQRSVIDLDFREQPWETIAHTGHKRVRDRRVPRGVYAVRYRVRARLSTGRQSDWCVPGQVTFGCRQGVSEPAADPNQAGNGGRAGQRGQDAA